MQLVQRYRAQLEDAEDRDQKAREYKAEQARRLLSPTVLRHLLANRAAVAAARQTDPITRAREARFLERSPSYGDALEAALAPPPDSIARITIEGLPWWVPQNPARADHLERVAKQGLPLRMILQTREVAPGPVMLDIGANIGRTSIPRVLLGDVRAVYAAEPDPNNYACLVRNVVEHGLRGQVLPDQVAIGAHVGTAELMQSSYIGGHRLRRETDQRKRQTVLVRSTTLDEWVRGLGVNLADVNFIKVDAQGAEAEILRGGGDVLARRHIAWQLEVDVQLLRAAGVSLQDLGELLSSAFTHFVDLNSQAAGPRLREIATFTESLAYLDAQHVKTDVLLYATQVSSTA